MAGWQTAACGGATRNGSAAAAALQSGHSLGIGVGFAVDGIPETDCDRHPDTDAGPARSGALRSRPLSRHWLTLARDLRYSA